MFVLAVYRCMKTFYVLVHAKTDQSYSIYLLMQIVLGYTVYQTFKLVQNETAIRSLHKLIINLWFKVYPWRLHIQSVKLQLDTNNKE